MPERTLSAPIASRFLTFLSMISARQSLPCGHALATGHPWKLRLTNAGAC
jgi:hypothetical protein